MLGLILIGGLLAISIGLIFLFKGVLDNNGKKILAGEIKQPEVGILRKFYDVDANYYSGLFFSIGLVISVAMMLVAFTWKFQDTEDLAEYVAPVAETEEIIDVPLTNIPPPPPPRVQVVTPEEIIEVENDIELDENIEIKIEDVEIEIDNIVTDVTAIEAPRQEEAVEQVFTIVEQSAVYPGGMDAFYKYVGKELKYPKQAKRMGIQGRVFVQFVVDKTGKLTDVKTVKGIGGGCDEEAERVLRESVRWAPAKQRGKTVKVRMNIPIVFKLDN
ncbi:TonB family protein [Bernardetia litoralis DSM 6794]|uniref:TonB family protein n=1 Tax=Bernardetia litoralis (strain ATCC 23117 / DSM 6794 / NBRC 15988 / NCIMB 1366 / Fx l1 / Sio-4) TaxID=880071 RepID=I4AN59_BERLS|nr:energy transducer TonB [Bernardetia litoralis]AFM05394.1 TonB family protein [Bernardetia litoralis DSM 6794]